MNLLIVNDNHIVTYYFNERDSQEIINRCQAASRLASRNIESEISLAEFDSLLKEILTSPVKARRWEVYQEINHHYQVAH